MFFEFPWIACDEKLVRGWARLEITQEVGSNQHSVDILRSFFSTRDQGDAIPHHV